MSDEPLHNSDRLDLLKARVASLETLRSPVSGNLGITPGGFYEDPMDKTPWYVKQHRNPEHAYSEHLTNQIYRGLGFNAPHSVVLHRHNGDPVYFSKIIPAFKTLDQHADESEKEWTPSRAWDIHSPAVARDFLRGTAADVLLHNSDLHHRNVGLVHGHTVTRVDNGSNFIHGPTGRPLGNRPVHLDEDFSYLLRDHYAPALRAPIRNIPEHIHGMPEHEQHDALHKELTSPEFLRPQVKQILKLRDRHGGWEHFVNRHIPGASEQFRTQAANRLELRTIALQRHVGLSDADTSGSMEKAFGAGIEVGVFDLLKARTASLEILNHPVGERGGVTEGGPHIDPEDSTPWYVKYHRHPDAAHAEHLSNEIYRALGHQAPRSEVLYRHVLDGTKRPVYFSKMIPGFKTLNDLHPKAKDPHAMMPPAAAKQFLKGTAADMLLRNIDLHLKNVGLVNGRAPARIDNGAGFMFDAWGNRQGRAISYEHPITTPLIYHEDVQRAANGGALPTHDVRHPDFLRPQVHEISKLRDRHGGWRHFVDRHVPGASTEFRTAAADMLESRTKDLERYVEPLTASAPVESKAPLPAQSKVSASVDRAFAGLDNRAASRPPQGSSRKQPPHFAELLRKHGISPNDPQATPKAARHVIRQVFGTGGTNEDPSWK